MTERTPIRKRLGAVDRRLFRSVADAHLPGFDRVLPRLSRAADNSLLWAGVAGALALTGRRRMRRAATRGLLAISLASPVVNLLGKQAFARNRPSIVDFPLARLGKMPSSHSFPSGHSASAAAFAAAVAMEAPARVAVPVAVTAGAVCFSRVYTGVHYPGDVLAGVALGLTAALVTTRLWPGQTVDGDARVAATAPLIDLDPDGEGVVAVVNDAAGRDPGTASAVAKVLPKAEVIEVQPGEELMDRLREAAGRARVLAVAGGDGTMNCGAQVAIEHGLPLLPIPAGTFDHFARTLGLETIQEAVAAYRAGHVVAVDVGEVAGKVFLNTASLGIYPLLVDRREHWEKRIGKWPALVLAMADVLMHDRRPQEMLVDGVRRRVWLLFAGNCAYESRGVAPTRRNRLEDGVLDLRLLTAASRLPRLRALASTVLGSAGLSRHYFQWRADTVHVAPLVTGERRVRAGGAAEEELRLARDGETFTATGPLVLSKRPRSLLVFRPIE
ncbi:phosphoesterase [Sphaerisporangium krabiense]|uniref:Undecaprenyl-diphosphatase n=1 Tax=Sphaerisporangium krabiense TaxID=763782 RepID=A0A7W9DSK2_9ACTN|nr:phosphatase PAP2 family protein [Sphaerisporangium krabiense]MBB5629618.1 undecaprenyl-diphosphatase [Sphaerisporangium krabiense]GII63716.1 phosphoesterase [Sphaerisporangium krabiense]